MRVLEVGTLNVKKGGPPYSMSRAMVGLKENGVASLCFMEPCKPEDIIDQSLEIRFSEPALFRVRGFEYYPRLRDSLKKLGRFDVMQIGLWTYFFHTAATYARQVGMPYVVSPRGSLYPEGLKEKWLKKKIAWYTYQKRDLLEAACIQATCEEEMKQIRNLGFKNPIAVIPNSYNVEEVPSGGYVDDGCFRVGYMGRLNPRKKVETVIYALDYLKRTIENVELYIIGSEVLDYEDFLKKETIRLGLQDSVIFTGFLKGKEKEKAIRKCKVFVFPSDFENWGNVVSDVLVREIPAITTTGMPWKIIEDEKCGWWIHNDQSTINKTLLEAYNMGLQALQRMGRRGREVVEQHFSTKQVGAMQKDLYEWILKGGQKPDFVYI